jgi:hypothetical protein
LKEDFRLQNLNSNRPELETILDEYMVQFGAKLEQKQQAKFQEMQAVMTSKDEEIARLR